MFFNRRQSKHCKVCSTDLITQHAENGVANETIQQNYTAANIKRVRTTTESYAIEAGGNTSNLSLTIFEPGYSMLGVTGYEITGTGIDKAVIVKMRVLNSLSGIYFRIANMGDSAINVSVQFYTLWVRD